VGGPTYLTETRAAYDIVASKYAELLHDELDHKPVDRAVIALFAELVTSNGGGWVADLGCGPGRVSAHLAKLGADVFGVDLSPAMLEVARCEYPYLSFFVGELGNLALNDSTVGGIIAWYSIIHTPPDRLRDTFLELRRVMASGATLLLAFQVGDERVHITHAYDHDVSLHAWRLDPSHIRGLLSDVGLTVHTEVVRAADDREKTPQAYLLALKQ
jgi:SAM-dependent methyltransferase